MDQNHAPSQVDLRQVLARNARKAVWAMALSAAVVLVVGTSCSGGASDGGEQAANSGPLDEAQAAIAAASAFETGTYRDSESPLDDVLYSGSVSTITFDREVEMQRCMQARGFEYFVESGEVHDSGYSGPSTMDDVRNHGYFIADSLIWDATESSEADSGTGEVRTNDDLLKSMSEAEYERWAQNAWGADDDETVLDEPPCVDVVYGTDQQTADLDVTPDLQDAVDDLMFRIDADPRVQEEREMWRTCMYEKGYEYVDTFAAEDSLMSEAYEIAKPDPSGRIPLESVPAIEAFKPKEIEVALADFNCREENGPSIIAEVRREYELTFIEENYEAIAEMYDASKE